MRRSLQVDNQTTQERQGGGTMNNERGEVVTGVLVVSMVVVMVFGMFFMHGGHGGQGSGGHCMQHEQKHDNHDEGIRHNHNGGELAAVSASEEGKQNKTE